MKERPIIFNAEMVRAILADKKSQTRRVIRPQPEYLDWAISPVWEWCPRKRTYIQAPTIEELNHLMLQHSPYQGVSKLWVRETWVDLRGFYGELDKVLYRADMSPEESSLISWKPSIFMPRWASRITLEIVNVKVERVQDITNQDAMAEGVYQWYLDTQANPDLDWSYWAPVHGSGAREKFAEMWDSIYNKKGFGWDANPWVYAIEFKRV